MSIPYGYKMVNGLLEVDEYQSKVILLMNELYLLKLTQEGIAVSIEDTDITYVFSKFKVPKTKTEGFNLEDHKVEIIKLCNAILKEKLEEKLEQMKEDLR